MIKRFSRLTMFLLFLSTAPISLAAELNVGDPIPSFRLIGSDGQWYTPEQFKGEKAIVIAWFPKAFTGG